MVVAALASDIYPRLNVGKIREVTLTPKRVGVTRWCLYEVFGQRGRAGTNSPGTIVVAVAIVAVTTSTIVAVTSVVCAANTEACCQAEHGD